MRSIAMLLMTAIVALVAALYASAGAPKKADTRPSAGPEPQPTAVAAQDGESLRIEGEKRFRDNCGRCHQPPHKFPPRMMATIVRHMRVRAMITDEDMKLILRYMTQ